MPPSSNQKYDAIIVGTGIAGLSVALSLARRKQKVLILGKKNPQGESSPAAAGILDPFLEMHSHHPLFKLSCEAFSRYPGWLKQLRKSGRGDFGYSRPGMLYVAFNRREEAELKKRYLWQRQSGIPVALKSRSEILQSEPSLAPQALSGLFYPTIGRIKPRIFLKFLFRYAKNLGIRILRTEKDIRLLTLKNQAKGIQVDSRVYRSEAVVNATGAWAGQNSYLGIRPFISPARGQILVVKGKKITSRILHSLTGFYIVPWEKNTYLLGSTVEFAGFKAETTPQGIRKIRRGTEKILPELKGYKIVNQWAGLRPFPKDRLPLIGPASIKGLFCALGFYRSGILVGSYVGELMAEGMISGKWPKLLKPFDPWRANHCHSREGGNLRQRTDPPSLWRTRG